MRRSRSATIVLIGLLLALLGAISLLGRSQQSASVPIAEPIAPGTSLATPTAGTRASIAPVATAQIHTGAATSAGDWPQYRHDLQRSGRAGAALQRGTDGALHLQWAYSFGERVEVEVEPIVAAGKVFVGAMNGTMTALNSTDGSVAWQFTQAGPIPHSAAYADGRLFFGSLDGAVYALDAVSGALIWQVQTGGPVYAAPAVANNTIYIGSTAGRFFALDAASGTERWHYPSGAARLATAFTGAAALSPDLSRLYIGNEDMAARALDAANGALIWQRQLTGVGMRSTYPVIADDGATVIFVTSKPGVQSYVPTEQYPEVAPEADPIATWNTYYQAHPERRATFFLDAANGTERWNPSNQRYLPLPLPYWGLLEPVLDSNNNAWFPTPSGAGGQFGAHTLDHDSRLIRIALTDGTATQVAIRDAFQLRNDENGRATFAGTDYLTTISEDLGVYATTANAKATLFGNGFGSHMDPLAPLPSKNLWRYGGTIAMGGVPGASPPVVTHGLVFYLSYGWLFALGPANQGKDPTGSSPIAFPARDARAHILTYPRANAPRFTALQAELEQRIIDLIAAGDRLPFAKFEQAGGLMQDEISGFQLFGTTGERIWIVAQALPLLPPGLRAQATAYLKTLAQQELFDPNQYVYRRDCLVYGQAGIKSDADCDTAKGIVATWFADNQLLTGERLYAMAAYSEATGDWSLVDANWSLIKTMFAQFTDAYDPALGFCRFEKWHVGKLGLASQIGAAAGMLRIATHRGDSALITQAQTLLDNLLATRVRLAHYTRDRYDAGALTPLPLRIDADGVPNRDDIFQYNDVGELLPLNGDRDRTSDTRQLNWYDRSDASIHSSAGFMHYAALVGYSPLYPELAERLWRDLLPETQQYVQTYEINAPWWWMSDLAHNTTAGGEHLWASPSLAHDLFQTKAWVVRENWSTLAHQLPLPTSINPRYDLYRLHNLSTLLTLYDHSEERTKTRFTSTYSR
ncbi:MAG: PQQ-binding-like beta-propeller repeat protein [Roseiflexaceae bacterium]